MPKPIDELRGGGEVDEDRTASSLPTAGLNERRSSLSGAPISSSPVVTSSPVSSSPVSNSPAPNSPAPNSPVSNVAKAPRSISAGSGIEPPPPPDLEVGEIWGRQRIIFLAASSIFFVLVAWVTREVVLPFVLAMIIAYVLTPLVAWCERRGLRRSVSIIVVYLVTLSTLGGSVSLIAPRIYQETLGLTRESPEIARRLAAQWGPIIEQRIETFLDRTSGPSATPHEPPSKTALEVIQRDDGSVGISVGAGVDIIQEGPKHWRVRQHLPDDGTFRVSDLLNDSVDGTLHYLKGNALHVLRVGQAIIARVSRGIFLTFMTLMVAGYLMHTRDQIFAFFRSLVPPPSRRSFDRLLYRMDRGLAGVVRGQLIICAVNGVLSAIGFVMFGLKYWPVMALIAGVMSIIPIFGSILSTVPAVLVGLTQDFWIALWVLLWILMIHQIEANLLNPKIIGVAARLHPVLVVFSLIVGEHFFGLWGALLAVPVLSLTQSLFIHFRLATMPDVPLDSVALTTPPPPRND
jgi:predicted PurR-regulated permease PerM